MFEVSSRPYLTNDLAFRLCFSIFYRFNVYVFMFINGIRPYKSSADHRKQTRDALSVAQVSAFDVKCFMRSTLLYIISIFG